MTGYIPQALRVPSYRKPAKVEVKEGRLIYLEFSYEDFGAIPDSIRKLVDLIYLYFDIIKEFAVQSVNIYSGFFRKSDQFDWIVL